MRRNLLFSLFLVLGLGLTLSSCAPGAYVGASVGAPYPYYYGRPYYGPGYYGPRYYAPPVRVVPARPYYHGDGGYHGYHGGGRRGGR